MANKSFRGDFDFAQIAELWYEQKNDFLSNVTLFLSILGSIGVSKIAHKILSDVTLILPRLLRIGVSEQDNTLQPSQPTNIHHYWDCVPECSY